MDKELYLLDGTSICYRSFYALRLSTKEGFPTGAIYGFLNTLRRIMKKFNPSYLGICFDVSRKTFRQDKFKEYKIQRPPTPRELKMQIPLIKKIINYLGIKIIEKEGWEADDLIASLVKKAKKEGIKVVIVSSDKDIFQLICKDKVVIYEPFKDKFYDEENFFQEFGFSPSQFVDYLTLVGDAVDNIPGAKGIGRRQAVDLIRKYENIEKIYQNLREISSPTREILEKEKEKVFLSKELVKLDEIELEIDWRDLKIEEPDYISLYKIFKSLEFKSFLKEIPVPSLNLNIEVREKIDLSLKERIKREGHLFFYVEGEDIYLWKDSVYKSKVKELKDILEDKSIRKISYNFKNLFKRNLPLEGEVFDVMIAAYLVDPSCESYSFSELINTFLDTFVEEVPSWSYPYFISQLFFSLQERLERYNLKEIFSEIEMPLVKVLSQMEKKGIKIDEEFLENFSYRITQRIFDLTKEIFNITGESFNLNSPVQLRRILFQKLKLPPLKKGKTGFSTDEETLLKLKEKHPLVPLLLEYRQLSKLKSTYIDNFRKEVKEGRLFTSFNQIGTQTGRITTVSPNLQNLPIQNPLMREIRKAIISSFEEGFILSADYSQIELRILAHFSQDKNLIEAFLKDLDIHKFTASLLFHIPVEEVTSSQRDLAKRINFGIIYGMGKKRLAEELGISISDAERFIHEYFLRYPGVKKYIEDITEKAKKEGWVKTLKGRIRFLKKDSPDLFLLERQAINTPIQASAADLIKMAMVKIHQEFLKENFSSRMILQIHDELVFDVKKEELERVKMIVKREMEEVFKLRVPLKVNLKVGRNWLEMEKI